MPQTTGAAIACEATFMPQTTGAAIAELLYFQDYLIPYNLFRYLHVLLYGLKF
jgi:hypothetical protein